jgi:hypothetical protein
MDLYSISSGTAVGNELGKEARSNNEFKIQQNAIMVGNIQQHLANDKQNKRDDTEFKVGMDSWGGTEQLLAVKGLYEKGLGNLAGETADNIRSAGNLIANLGKAKISPSTLALGEKVQLGVAPALKPADLGITTAEDVSKGMAEGLDVAKSTFSGIAEAGSVSKFLLNKVGGITSKVGLEVGGKAIGAVGGAISAGQDISNMIDTGHIFKPGESVWSEAGNITSMAGAALDMASMAVPILAPLALGLNIFSAVSSTIGTEQDDKKQISTDSKPPPTQSLSIHPAWSAVGMTASVHQPSIA